MNLRETIGAKIDETASKRCVHVCSTNKRIKSTDEWHKQSWEKPQLYEEKNKASLIKGHQLITKYSFG